VRFAALPAREIERYVAGGDAFGKAGAYAIQSGIAAWINRFVGSHSGIMGVPLYETAQLLHKAGVAIG
jgi:septum formation protein